MILACQEERMGDEEGLLARIERLEALDEIRQLPARYALCVDMRDMDALVNLFVEDIGAPGGGRGRAALRRWYDTALRSGPSGTAHGVAGHIIEFESPTLASGLVYSRNDLETPTAWLIEMMAYLDRYSRRDGRWYFQRRTPLYWYECDITNPPLGEKKLRWPGREPGEGAFHDAFPSWAEFWDRVDGDADAPVPPPAAVGRFLETVRRGRGSPRVSPAGGASAASAAGRG
jgi:SnoaL-like domain